MYKGVASYLNFSYSFLMEKHNIISTCQHGGERNTPTADHIYSVLSRNALLRAHNKHLYMYYIDFNKAFNSVITMACGNCLNDLDFPPA